MSEPGDKIKAALDANNAASETALAETKAEAETLEEALKTGAPTNVIPWSLAQPSIEQESGQ
jgi:hypothetical protein